MFDDLREAFREAVSNFKEELSRDEVPETIDQLVKNMQLSVIDARAYLKKLEEEMERAEALVAKRREDAAVCRRRRAMAEKIGDDETAKIAADFARKHEQRAEILDRKVSAMKQERALLRADLKEMTDKLRAAMAERDGLAATAGRAQARSSIRDSGDFFADLDRMEEEIWSESRRSDAEAELDEEMGGDGDGSPPFDLGAIDHDALAEDRLKELKRRMGRE